MYKDCIMDKLREKFLENLHKYSHVMGTGSAIGGCGCTFSTSMFGENECVYASACDYHSLDDEMHELLKEQRDILLQDEVNVEAFYEINSKIAKKIGERHAQ